MIQIKKIGCISLVVSSVLLAGCGEEDGSSGSVPPIDTPTPMLAMDGFSVTKPNTQTFVDLSPFVRGGHVQIASVAPDEDNPLCGSPEVSGSGINVNIEDGAFCQFVYTAVQDNTPSARASLNVLATNAADPILLPVSKALVVGSSATQFNLPELLKEQWKDTYSLNEASVQVQGMEGNLGTGTAEGNVITFTPPELAGWNRVVFTLTDRAAPTEPVMATIYVTISAAINKPPQIAQPKYTYTSTTPVYAGTATALDLSTLPGLGITEPDEQDWQLVNVQSFSATVASARPNSVTNKTLTFTAATLGEHVVSYIIADHYGGYATGLIKVNVQAKGGASTWTHITQGSMHFTAPLTYTQSQAGEILTQGIWDEGVNNTVAGFKKNAAAQYCASVGSLPLKNNFETMRKANESGSTLTGELAKWPKLKPYLVVDGSTYKGIQLPAGTVSNYNPGESYYVTCLESRDMSLTMLTRTVVANGQAVPVAKISMPSSMDTFTLTKIGGTLPDDAAYKDLAEGKETTILASSTKVGDYQFSVMDDDDNSIALESSMITFVFDPETVSVKPEVIVRTAPVNYLPDTSDEAKVTFTLSDANGNTVANKPISIQLSSQTAWYRTEPRNGSTDANGVLNVFVKNKVKETVTVTPTVTINGVRTASETAQVTFMPQFPCQGGGFNCLPVVEDNVPGKLYTPTPERVFVEKMGFTPNGYRTENGTKGPNGFRTAKMDWNTAEGWCLVLSTKAHAGRTNWRMPTKDELVGLYVKHRNMFSQYSWPAGYSWSTTTKSTSYYVVDLITGNAGTAKPSSEYLASCVSNPPVDLESAHFDETTGLVIDINNVFADGSAYNQLTATLTDRYGAPVPGVQVTAELTEKGTTANTTRVTYHPHTTDSNGQTVIRITNTEAEVVSVRVEAKPVEAGSVVESSVKEITFSSDLLAINSFPCPGGGFNCLPVAEGNVPGKLYTPTPERVFVENMGFTPNGYYIENGTAGLNGFRGAIMDRQSAEEWCSVLSAKAHAGRTNWRTPTKEELVGLYGKRGNVDSNRSSFPYYVSCVSNP